VVNDKNPSPPTISELLEFEAAETGAGNREGRIRARFGISTSAYFQMLHRAIDHPDALAIDATTTNRLRRLRDRRRAARTSPTFRP